MKHQLICINCPRGCHLEAEENDGQIFVTGNACPRGDAYAKQELTDPRRVVTAVVRTDNPAQPYLPVKTDAPLPKRHIAALLNQLYQMTVHAPVASGTVVLTNIFDTGIAVVATGSC